MCSRFLSRFGTILMLLAFCLPCFSSASPLKVCADPDNLPHSNRASEGYENKIAELLARDLGRPLQYHWARLGRGFVREYLNQHECDLLIEVPKGYPQILTTPPYFTSTYVFVSRESRNLEVTSFEDPRLRNFRIGLQTVADDYTPPGHALARKSFRNTSTSPCSCCGKSMERRIPTATATVSSATTTSSGNASGT
jgi:mxaJ protein